MPLKILIVVGNLKEALYYERISNYLQHDYEVEVIFLTPFSSTKSALNQIGRHCFSLGDLLTHLENNPHQDSTEQILEANRLLGKTDINFFLRSDILLHRIDHKIAQTFLARTVIGLSRFFKNNQFNICIRYGGGDAFSLIVLTLAESMDVDTYTLTSCVTFDSCSLMKSSQWYWTSFKEKWDSCRGSTLPDEEKQKINENIRIKCESHKSTPIIFKHGLIMNIILNLLLYLSKRGTLPRDFLIKADMDMLVPLLDKHMAKRKMEWLITYPLFKYDKIPDNYVYLPLNMPEDAPHRNPSAMGNMQECFVKNVLASLPWSYELVIKEHPYTYGEPTHKKLKGLQKIGVRVVPPYISSLELIKNSKAVITVGESSGWEAIMLKKPLILVGGEPFYTEFPNVWYLTDHNKLYYTLHEALLTGDAAYKDEDIWYSFLYAAFESGYPGNIWAYKQILWKDTDDSDENVQNIATMIAKEAIHRYNKSS